MSDLELCFDPWDGHDDPTRDRFHELFEGRRDVIYTDHNRAMAIRPDPKVRDSLFYGHLTGGAESYKFGIGVYPLRDGHECRWICSDLDGPGAAREADALLWGWEHYGVKAWVERSKSKGYHVWVFADDWMSGTVARRAGLWVHGIAGVEPTELNPKTEMADGYGNCVRVPYPALRYRGRQVVLATGSDSEPLDAATFSFEALSRATPVEDLIRLAQKWQPPKPRFEKRERHDSDPDPDREPQNHHILGVLFEGDMVPEGSRDIIFHCLAMTMWGLEFDYDEARESMQEVWEEQTENKSTYSLGEALRKVDRAYGVRGVGRMGKMGKMGKTRTGRGQ